MRNVSTIEKLSSHHPRVTKRITDIFRSTCKRILIEGAPGIGKTVLAKEIAYCWANGEILTDTKLLLLVIRDPNLHCVSSITELVYYLNNDYLSDSEVEVAVDELRKSKGSGIVLVIDGYDECPSDSKLKGFVDKLVEGKCLPMCMVAITSRPTASLLLRQLVNQRIEVLGLAKKEQDQYISESLKQSPDKIIRLQEYLKQQPIINSLIYVPLHLAVLLYLFKLDSLPETLTEMNEYFIIHTIYRHLTKGKQFSYIKIDKITDLPEPELTIVYHLSELAYNGLCDSKLVFTYDEMKRVCPKIDETPGAINGFGLMQTVECYHQKGAATGKAISLNFLHFTMQEYLAALHVSTLPSEKQSSLIENKFWEGKFNFMWIMYVGIVGTQSTDFKRVIDMQHSSAPQDTEYNIPAKEKLFLFQCYLEGKDAKLIPKAITSIFSDGNINLSKVTLLPHHIMSLTVFMMRSTTQWKSLNLNSCATGSNGMSILAKFFVDFKERVVTIKYINLRNNRLTSLWGTHLDQDHTDDVNSGILESVEDLDLSLNLLCDREISSISECLKINRTLCKLNLSNNKITDEGAKRLTEGIKVNVTLEELNLSENWISKEGVMRIVEACRINRTLHKLVCTCNNLSKSGLAAINEYIRKENAVQIFDASWNSLSSKYNQLAFKTTFESLRIKKELQPDYDESSSDRPLGYYNMEKLWYVDEIIDPKYVRKFLQCSLDDVQSVNVIDAIMTNDQMSIFCDCLMNNSTLTELNLSSNKITDEGTKRLAEAIKVITTLQSLDISHNALSDVGMSSISDYLKFNSTLFKLNLSSNEISDKGAKRLAEAIQVNTTLQELNISKNWISKKGVMRIVEACTIKRTLHKLVCTHNNLSKSGLAVINEYIRKENAVQIFEASWNSLSSKYNQLAFKTTFESLCIKKELLPDYDESCSNSLLGYYNMEKLWYVDKIIDPKYVRKFLQCSLDDVQSVNVIDATMTNDQMSIFCDCLMNKSTLTELNLSSNKITDEGTKRLAEAIKVITTLQSLDISHNALSDVGMSSISDYLKFNSTLFKLNLSSNEISDKGAKRLAEAIQVNTTLQELNITKNWISKEGVMRIVEACTINRTLHKLVCTHNNLSKSGLAVINEYIRKENAVQIFDASWNSLSSKYNQLAFKTTFESLCIKKELQPDYDESSSDRPLGYYNMEKLWYVDEIIDPKYVRKFLQCSLDDVQSVNVIDATMTNDQMSIFCDCLMNKSTLTELNLSSNKITDEGTKRLAEAIKVITTRQSLYISHNTLSDVGMSSISDCLKNSTLCKLNLSGNKITDEGAKGLAEAIQVNTTLQELNISKNWISKEGVMRIVEACTINRTLHKLVCTHNNLSKSGLAVINEYIRKENAVQIFEASWNSLGSKGNQLAFNTTFELLDIKELSDYSNSKEEEFRHVNEITDQKYVKQLLQCCLDAQSVNVTGAIMTNDQMLIFCDCLMNNSTLTELNLSSNEITDEGAKRLAEAIQVNTTLQSLDISHNTISDNGIFSISDCLKINSTLCKLNLSSNKITDEGAIRVAEAIQVNTTLQCLDISHNTLSYSGISSISGCLKINSTLHELNLTNNKITDEEVVRLTEAIKVNTTLQSLDISHNTLSYSGISSTKISSISDCLKINSTLHKLNLTNNEITDEGAKRLAEAIQVNTTLQELNISENWISKEGVMRIVEACTINRTPHKLVCTHNNLSKSGLAVINEYIRKENAVQIFEASYNTVIASSSFGPQLHLVIPKFQSLIWSPDGWENNLFDYDKQVYLVNDTIWENISCRFTHNSLIELKLPYYSIFPNAQVDIVQGIMQVYTLLKLSISRNEISDDGAIAFSECLKTNTTLIEIDMSWNNITCKGASVIAKAVQVNTALQKLNISWNRISDDGAIAFSKCLKTNTTLIELNMSHNNISYRILQSVDQAIKASVPHETCCLL